MRKKILAVMILILIIGACARRPKPVKRAVNVKTGAVKGAVNVVK